MKQYWQKLAARIDARNMRERVMIFAAAAIVLLSLVNNLLLDPLFSKQNQLSQKLKQDQAQLAALQSAIQQKISSKQTDPDVSNRSRLAQLKLQSAQMNEQLREMQKGLVSPDKMSSLLEDILRRNGRLRLISLKTMSPSSLNPVSPPEVKNTTEKSDAAPMPKDQTDPNAADGAVYKHGVEIVVEGGYLDILNYMAELETMPWQLYWGKAKLQVGEYPQATLSLTLFTLSLDKKWLNL